MKWVGTVEFEEEANGSLRDTIPQGGGGAWWERANSCARGRRGLGSDVGGAVVSLFLK